MQPYCMPNSDTHKNQLYMQQFLGKSVGNSIYVLVALYWSDLSHFEEDGEECVLSPSKAWCIFINYFLPKSCTGIASTEKASNITLYLYREEINQKIHHFDSLQIKQTKLLCNLSFLIRCWDQIIPMFAKFTHVVHSVAVKRKLCRTSFSLIRKSIHHSRYEL